MEDLQARHELGVMLLAKNYPANSSLKVMWADLFSENFRNYVRVYKYVNFPRFLSSFF